MSRARETVALDARVPDDPEAIVRSLTAISENLLSSYTKLAQRAARVEGELVIANAELANKVAELDALLQALPTGVVVRDQHERIVRVNAAACEILGANADELVGAGSNPGLRGREASGECVDVVRADGARRSIAARWSEIRSGNVAHGSVEILDDRTAIERLRERLHAQSKMAALGTMAGGIAHEIRNPLNAVRGFAELLKRELAAETKGHRFAERICRGVEEIDQIIASMLTLSAPERLVIESVDPKTLAQEAIAAARRILPENASEERWSVNWCVSAPRFAADRIKVRQALRNLVANGLQAQPSGGAVSVSITLDSGDILLRVQDAGPGIPLENRARIAEPFFTTRAEGTGLGLALVHSIAELHGGRLEVSPDSAPLGGADVAFRIPYQPD